MCFRLVFGFLGIFEAFFLKKKGSIVQKLVQEVFNLFVICAILFYVV